MSLRTFGISAVATIVVAVALYLFQPWRLFTDREVQDTLPPVASSSDTGSPGAPGPGTPDPAASNPGPSDPGTSAPRTSTRTPTAEAPTTGTPAARTLAAGDFVSHEHDTRGRAELVRLPDGERRLLLRDLNTSDGPDLRVWLTDRPVRTGRDGWRVFDDGQWVELARLKGNRGNQVYDVPPSVDIDQIRSVTIWCKRFAVSFGAAPLTSA